MKTVKLSVEGMHCEGCVSRVKSALGEVPGVEDVDVSLDQGAADVRAEDSADEDALVHAVGEAGYTAELQSGAS